VFRLTGNTNMAAQHPKIGMEKVEAEITFERNEMATRFQRLHPPIFFTTLDSDLTPTTRPDIGQHPEFKMTVTNRK